MFLNDIENYATLYEHRACLIHWENEGYKVLSFGQFAEFSDRLAAAALSRLKGDSKVVLIVLRHHFLQLPLFVGCMKAGLIPSFLPFPSPKQDSELYWKSHEELMRRIRPGLIITNGDNLAEIASILDCSAVGVVDISNLVDYRGLYSWQAPEADVVALLQHSSGTTGLKKGVMLTYREIELQTRSYADAVRLDHDSIIVSWLPYYHDMGLFTAFLIPLSVGATIISIDPFEWVRQPRLLLELIQRFRGTHCWMPNFALNHLVNTVPEDHNYNLDSLRAIVSCSEPVKEESFERFLTRFGKSGVTRSKLKTCYAMAETCFAVTQSAMCSEVQTRWYDIDRLSRHSLAVRRKPGCPGARPYVSNGSAIRGIDIRIFLDQCDPLAGPSIGVPVGEIGLRGGFVFKGFFKNKEATATAFYEDWFRSGDIGFIDEGHLFICGRKKDILIIHGRNYYAHDIEAVVSDVPDIIPGRTVAIGVFNDEVGSEEAMVLAETDVDEGMHADLRRTIKRRVEAALQFIPHKVCFIPRGWLVKTTSGKVSRSENYKKYLIWTKNGDRKPEQRPDVPNSFADSWDIWRSSGKHHK